MKHVNRRNFLKTTLAGSATALLTACDNDPVEDLIPFLIPPDDFVPGQSIHFATVCKECTAQCGMVVRTREGRAVKVEGNPFHPLNRGALCAKGQASLQGLYNPSRVKGPFSRTSDGEAEIRWDQGIQQLADTIQELKKSAKQQKILYFCRPDTGTEFELIKQLISQLDNAELVVLDLSPTNAISEAAHKLFGIREIPSYRFDKAERIINFGADFMESWLSPVESMAGFSENNYADTGQKKLYSFISSRLSLSGSSADQQVFCKPGEEISVCYSLIYLLSQRSQNITGEQKNQLQNFLSPFSPDNVEAKLGIPTNLLEQIANRIGLDGKSLVIGGGNAVAGQNSTELQMAIHLLNYLAGNVGKTVLFGSESTYQRHRLHTLPQHIEDMKSQKVGLVVFDNVNPVYSLPQNSGFAEALKQVADIVAFSTCHDETSNLATLHLPVSHPLESWGDSNPRKGIYGIQQPVMSTLPGYQPVQRGDLLLQLGKSLKLTGFEATSFYAHLQTAWLEIQKQTKNSGTFTEFWTSSLTKGGVFKEFPPVAITLKPFWISPKPKPLSQSKTGITLLPVNTVFHEANGYSGDKYWLYEIPDPITQVVWDSWVEIHPKTAEKLGIQNGEWVEIRNNKGQSIRSAAWIYQGIKEDCIAMPTGMGRSLQFPDYTNFKRDLFIPTKHSDARRLKPIQTGVNPLDLLDFSFDPDSGDLVYNETIVTLKPLGKPANLVTVDGHYGLSRIGKQDKNVNLSQQERQLIQKHLAENNADTEQKNHTEKGHQKKDRKFKTKDGSSSHSFYNDVKESVRNHPFGLLGKDTPNYHDPYRWELVIDLDRCTGCSACVAACYAENNIAVVGKQRQEVGREMSWLRIERYFHTNSKSGQLETDFIPQMCAQCENAGCEPVCPLYATYQNPDGINTMIYARCAGTRYCANNCIYKSRKFNWRTYVFPSPLHLQLNPDVTVRDKGVMEKCTFCIQRIKDVKQKAKKEGRQVNQDEIQTACQQTCPTQAITFGNGLDKNGRFAALKNDKRAYHQLEDLNYKPAVTYLSKVKTS